MASGVCYSTSWRGRRWCAWAPLPPGGLRAPQHCGQGSGQGLPDLPPRGCATGHPGEQWALQDRPGGVRGFSKAGSKADTPTPEGVRPAASMFLTKEASHVFLKNKKGGTCKGASSALAAHGSSRLLRPQLHPRFGVFLPAQLQAQHIPHPTIKREQIERPRTAVRPCCALQPPDHPGRWSLWPGPQFGWGRAPQWGGHRTLAPLRASEAPSIIWGSR